MTLTLIQGSRPEPGTAVLGLDLSLTGTGLCRIYPDGVVAPWTIGSKGARDATMKQRVARVRDLADRIVDTILPGDAVILEGTAPSRGADSGVEDRLLLRGLVILTLADRGHTIDSIAPGTVKKWATGSGRASKNEMGLHIGRLFPNVPLANDNEVDALAMAHCSAVRLGYDVPVRAQHKAGNYAAVRWETPAG